MRRPDPRRARVLGLWTAGWLAAFLLSGMFWLGEPSVQWPVLAVPLLWALVALRPRRNRSDRGRDDDWADDDGWDDRRWDDGRWDDDRWDDDRWDDGRWDDGRSDDGRSDDRATADPRRHRQPPAAPTPAERTDTVERPALRRPSEDDTRGHGRGH
ncbi:hypothetical protein [Blastococcus goldschmidtiae]|uniref:Uncharacterized protein n=1 Tax=Blastococcus goldschmidtiae TaxID=3075546 RepID=A0ABU2K658_9ACTN|nr:hypothetical protein [Blastococcus sp. DSM 46792]MDT0275668.1 hypothetical protein [Blastococcus sp. DSM 46792]